MTRGDRWLNITIAVGAVLSIACWLVIIAMLKVALDERRSVVGEIRIQAEKNYNAILRVEAKVDQLGPK